MAQEFEVAVEATIELSADEIESLFDEEFAGKCPACRFDKIDQHDVVCCRCLAKARRYHGANCCPD